MGDYSEKRKKSWKEIDQAKDGGGGSRKKEEQRQERANKSKAMSDYKKQLDSFFAGTAGVPDAMKKDLGGVGMPEGLLQKLAAMKNAIAEEELVQATASYLDKGYGFPENDMELFIKLLEHPDEAIIMQALEHLETLFDEKLLPHRRNVILRLETLELSADDDDVRELAAIVKEKIEI